MAFCFKCGIDSIEERLFEAVGNSGIVFVCGTCSRKEDIPLLKKPTTYQLKESEGIVEEQKSYRERRYKEMGKSVPGSIQQNIKIQKNPDELTLNDLMNRKFRKSDENTGNQDFVNRPRIPLIDNFHWEIMMARRGKHLTQKQVGEALAESESVIKMVERGELPEDDFRIIAKLENFFGIKLISSGKSAEESLMEVERIQPARILNFDPNAVKKLTISDLKEIKKQKESFEKKYDADLERELNTRGSLNLEEKGFIDSSGTMTSNLNKRGEEGKESELGNKPIKVKSQEEFDRIVEDEVIKEVKENLKKEEELDDEDINDIIWGKK